MTDNNLDGINHETQPEPTTPYSSRLPHQHKYFMFQVKKDFEPVIMADGSILYKMVEYGYSGCNCGFGVKSQIKEKS